MHQNQNPNPSDIIKFSNLNTCPARGDEIKIRSITAVMRQVSASSILTLTLQLTYKSAMSQLHNAKNNDSLKGGGTYKAGVANATPSF